MYDEETTGPFCIACCQHEPAHNALPIWERNNDAATMLYLCDDCLRNAHTFAGYATWSDHMKDARDRILERKDYR